MLSTWGGHTALPVIMVKIAMLIKGFIQESKYYKFEETIDNNRTLLSDLLPLKVTAYLKQYLLAIVNMKLLRKRK